MALDKVLGDEAIRVVGRIYFVTCPWCSGTHEHGAQRGWRLAHCCIGSMRGYYLQPSEAAVERGRGTIDPYSEPAGRTFVKPDDAHLRPRARDAARQREREARDAERATRAAERERQYVAERAAQREADERQHAAELARLEQMMEGERHLSMRAAAKELHRSTDTVRSWMQEAGILPRPPGRPPKVTS